MSSFSPGNRTDGLAPEGGRLMTGLREDWDQLALGADSVSTFGGSEVGGGPH